VDVWAVILSAAALMAAFAPLAWQDWRAVQDRQRAERLAELVERARARDRGGRS